MVANDDPERARRAVSPALLRAAALLLVVAALGLPINQLSSYAVLLIAAVLVLGGRVLRRPAAWCAAVVAIAIAIVLPLLLAPPAIEEGDNVFLPGGVLEHGLPVPVYQQMLAQFDALYPPSVRCDGKTDGCWQASGPERTYGFAADGIFSKTPYSRAVNTIDFSDPVWLRLGFVNDLRYNWLTKAPDVHRVDRNRAFWMGLHRWTMTMPWFAMYRFPVDAVGGRLCWRGDVLWPAADGGYALLSHITSECRTLAAGDAGRMIFAMAIRPGTLAMTWHPPAMVQARIVVCALVRLLAGIGVLILLVRARAADVMRPFVLIGLALVVVAIGDASFIGGWRPMDGGDDGLFYTGTGRLILQNALDGNITAALIGGEKVYYYGGPGLRYFRALEMVVFGDTNLGYLSVILAMPVIVLALFRRFLSERFAWRLALIFTVLPVGAIFGTSFFHYAEWAARGFADPMAHVLVIWSVLAIVAVHQNRFTPAAGSALLVALAVFCKPIVAPIPGIMLAGAGIAALAQQQWRRVIGLCVGFLPVLVMPLHNWYFGDAFVLLSSNARLPGTYVMPPYDYWSALVELLTLNFSGPHLHDALHQVVAWLSEPSQTPFSIPFNAVAVVIVVYVAVRGVRFDPWLRLIAAAVIAEYVVDLVYAATPRYFFEMWLLTVVIVAVFLERQVPVWLDRRGWQGGKRFLGRLLGEPAPQLS